jgi:uncharacterized protein YegJ (DUF2314 family)
MLSHWLALAGIIAAALATTGGCAPSAVEDKVVHVADDDPEMNKAIADARARLPAFWSTFDNPAQDQSDFALKVEISDANGTEFFWANRLSRRDGKIFGTINNDPNIVKSVKFGEEIEVPPDKIADWMYMQAGKMHGNYTMRPLLKQLPKAEADRLRAKLAEP